MDIAHRKADRQRAVDRKISLAERATPWLFISLCALAAGSSSVPAYAQDTDVTCADPQLQVNTGRNGSSPRIAVYCAKGSSAPGIYWYSYRVSDNPTVAQLIGLDYQAYFQEAATQGCHLHFLSNLSDTSGNAWGCGGANCRIIDFIYCGFP